MVDGECCERMFSFMGKFSYTSRNMSPQNRRDQLESALLFLRNRSVQDIAKKQMRKHKEYLSKREETRGIFLDFCQNGETEDELNERARKAFEDYVSEPTSPSNAADKLASEYQFKKTILKKRLLGGMFLL